MDMGHGYDMTPHGHAIWFTRTTTGSEFEPAIARGESNFHSAPLPTWVPPLVVIWVHFVTHNCDARSLGNPLAMRHTSQSPESQLCLVNLLLESSETLGNVLYFLELVWLETLDCCYLLILKAIFAAKQHINMPHTCVRPQIMLNAFWFIAS